MKGAITDRFICEPATWPKSRRALLSDKDHYCGNEETYYPPLTELSHAMPAVAVSSRFVGKDLGVEWKIFDKRSAFVGSFSKDVALVFETH